MTEAPAYCRPQVLLIANVFVFIIISKYQNTIPGQQSQTGFTMKNGALLKICVRNFICQQVELYSAFEKWYRYA
jgi:hypothetical protein